MNRRDFLKLGLTAGSFVAFGGGSELVTRVYGQTETKTKLLILGFDGMDPHLVEIWMNERIAYVVERDRTRSAFDLVDDPAILVDAHPLPSPQVLVFQLGIAIGRRVHARDASQIARG